jgi:ATP-binding cassette subfamily F protein uup
MAAVKRGHPVLILSVEQLSKSYSERTLIKDVSLSISDGDRIGLIGVNGAGKSTLLRLLAGLEPPDAGQRMVSSTARIDFLPQQPDFERGKTVIEQVFSGQSPELVLLRAYEEALEQVRRYPGEAKWEKRLISLTHEMDVKDAWGMESEAKTILTKLGITDFQQDVGTLSGGMKKRVAMAAALIRPCDLLILDEPTNHIDNETVDWLEGHLARHRGALLLVTHDRYFLERVVNRVIELDRGTLTTYEANYSKYLEMRLAREEQEEAMERKRQNLFRAELAWIRRGARARTTKQKARIDRFEAIQEAEPEAARGKVSDITVGAARLGRQIIDLDGVTKGFDKGPLFKDFDLHLKRDDRIGIVGPNGCGKSTLLRLISGRMAPDAGTIRVGETVRIGFFTQENEGMNESLRVLEYLQGEAGLVQTREGSLSAAQMLERFLFPPETQWTPIARLSGGEKRRLYLLRILMDMPNILLLDEPTNDLDIQTLGVLEAWIDEFPGTVVAVSHDRYFLDRIATALLVFDGEGGLQAQAGNWSDWKQLRDQQRSQSGGQPPTKPGGQTPGRTGGQTPSASKGQAPTEGPRRFTFREQREFEEIDARVEGLEQAVAEAAAALEAGASDYQQLPGLLARKEALDAELEAAVERWAYLHEIHEQLVQG